mmetsp:Transcript_164852/g.529050  ORF Transcript_164852/g.529050 Transcript_164852/m.529050 type:complete len:244 (-) Transcript_164852:842-1573(-)
MPLAPAMAVADAAAGTDASCTIPNHGCVCNTEHLTRQGARGARRRWYGSSKRASRGHPTRAEARHHHRTVDGAVGAPSHGQSRAALQGATTTTAAAAAGGTGTGRGGGRTGPAAHHASQQGRHQRLLLRPWWQLLQQRHCPRCTLCSHCHARCRGNGLRRHSGWRRCGRCGGVRRLAPELYHARSTHSIQRRKRGSARGRMRRLCAAHGIGQLVEYLLRLRRGIAESRSAVRHRPCRAPVRPP